jgi:hypothetical protein
MDKARPIYKKALIAAIVIYIIGLTLILVDMYIKIGAIEHALAHMCAEHQHDH